MRTRSTAPDNSGCSCTTSALRKPRFFNASSAAGQPGYPQRVLGEQSQLLKAAEQAPKTAPIH
jgi:hypothetical protein